MASRRSFLWRLGAGASSALASTAIVARPEAAAGTSATSKAELLEAEQLLRQLHQSFEQAMDQGLHEPVIALFTEDAQVVFNGGVFRGRAHGVTRFYRDLMPAGLSGRRMPSAPGFQLSGNQLRDAVVVAPDLKSATGEFTYSIQVGEPLREDTSLAAMARLHGEGVRTWWEGGIYRADYWRSPASHWMIARLHYDTLSRADYRAGRSYAEPIEVQRLATRFPAHPQGPDALV